MNLGHNFRVQSVHRNNGILQIHWVAEIAGKPADVYANLPCPEDIALADDVWRLYASLVRRENS
jgi:hypothetical protein